MLKKLLQIKSINELEEGEVEEFFDYEKLSNYILSVSYLEADNFFLTADNMLGFGWLVGIKSGLGHETLNFLENGIYQDSQIPENSIVQWIMWAGDFLHPLLKRYKQMKDQKNKEILKIVDSYVDFVRKKSKSYIYDDWQVPIRNVDAFFTIKIPFNLKNMTESKYLERLALARQIRDSLESTLFQSNFSPYRMSINEYFLFARSFANPNHTMEELSCRYNEDISINKQVINRETVVTQYESSNVIKIDGVYSKVLSIKQYPSEFTSVDVSEWLGSIRHINRNQVNSRFIAGFILRKITETEKGSILRKAETILKQKSFTALSTKLQERQDDAVLVGREIEKGQVVWRGLLMYYLYDEDIKRLNSAVRTFKNMNMINNIVLQEEIVTVPFFMSLLPFNSYHSLTTSQVARASVMFSYNAAHLTAVQFDWKGSGTPVVPMISRRGQLAFIDLWDTNGGMNASVVGPMGQGKSMFVNHLIFNYRSLPNTKVRVIDVGESYLGISKLFNGNFVKPQFRSPIKINPFSQIKNIDQEMDFLVNIVDTMIKPNESCTDTERGMIQVAIRNAYEKYDNDMDINTVRDEINRIAEENKDYDFKKLADFNLSSWCSKGQYGQFMTGRSEIEFNNNLIVFELGAIKDDAVLTNVVLLSIFYFINKEIYQGNRSIKKLIIWDEAWRFANNRTVLKFIEQGAREYRKFNASLVFITQSISDLLMNDVTKVLKNNSEYLFIFWEPPEEWERIAKDKDIYISNYEKEIYRDTIKTFKGKYSEVLVISRSTGRGILRLVLPEDLYWIYTTDASEVALRSKFMEKTNDIIEAVGLCAEAKKQGRIEEILKNG